jgi:dTDP-L-rhamnose 4-epimerase
LSKKILITGGAGFIGSELVKQLHITGEYEITVLDVMTEQIHGKDWDGSFLFSQIKDKCRFIKADICDYDAVYSAVAGQNYIIHLAAETGTGQSMYRINRYNEVNIMGTSNLLQAISSLGSNNTVEKIILSSSRSVYGEGEYKCPKCGIVYPSARSKERMLQKDFGMYCDNCGAALHIIPTTEKCEVKPNSLYAFTKYAQEEMLKTMCPALGVDYTIFRFQNVYGVGQSLRNPYTGILSIFSTLLLEDKPINIFEDGNESRDFVNVKDIADGVIATLNCEKSNREIINLGSGIATSVIDIATMLKDLYESNSEIHITGDFRVGDIAHNFADISKARELIGFKPTVSLNDGLSAFCAWVRGQEKDNSGYEKSLSEMQRAGLFISRRR